MSDERMYQYTMKDGELISVEEVKNENSVGSTPPLDVFSFMTGVDNDSEVK
jgi:hypothetical protein